MVPKDGIEDCQEFGSGLGLRSTAAGTLNLPASGRRGGQAELPPVDLARLGRIDPVLSGSPRADGPLAEGAWLMGSA